ncbi:bacterio-opsin activator [Natrarchaeobius halalkaliphilus]|uniref:Bacterio-opsin activator n=1 Tax=Natrarchaeobius halalkaliphilus TaxID=1679091 RepID=A0A3N6LLR6_9EURY|nr:helix-turn-helix domain-containing protein [Natrarchaeobius halalkaliphilus]RQG89973.1 bacterio-opsin activator [Natrarchaeobius halalkaliphilus]
MSVIATISVPTTEFPFGTLLEADPETTLTVETTVPTSTGAVPYLWISAPQPDCVVGAIDAASTVESVSIVDRMNGHVLVSIDWIDRINGVLRAIERGDAIVTSAVGTHEGWSFRLRFPAYEELSTFYTDCADRGISIELVQLHETVSPDCDGRFGLTAAQRELVIAAYESGYFDVPRETTLVELGDRFGISDSAVSQRLRRGLAALIDTTMAVETDTQKSVNSDGQATPETGTETD